MAKANSGAQDIRIAGAASSDAGQAEFDAVADASPWCRLSGRFFMGAWAGATPPVGAQVQLQCSPDGGTTVLNCTLPVGADNSWSVPVAQFPEAHGEADFVYRLYCSALTSGTIAWRLSQ
jgi:hypothetical protein